MPSPDMDQMDRKQNDQSRRPLSVATDNMMLEFYKKDGYDSSVSLSDAFQSPTDMLADISYLRILLLAFMTANRWKFKK